MKTNQQWYSVGFWRPGQEVKLTPLFSDFFQKISKIVDPKINLGHFQIQNDKKKKKKKGGAHSYAMTLLHTLLSYILHLYALMT